MQMMVSLQKHGGWRSMQKTTAGQKPVMTFPDVPFWKRRSKEVKELIHYVSGLITEQNIARTLDRAPTAQSDAGGIKSTKHTSLVDVLQAHCDLLLSWNNGDQCRFAEHVITIRSLPRTEQSAHQPKDGSHLSDIHGEVTQRGGDMLQSGHSFRRGSKEAVQSARHTHAALRVQSWARGWITRKKLKKILSSAVYFDDELEAMLGEGDPFAEYEGFLSKTAPELEDDWLQPRSGHAVSQSKRTGSGDEYDAVITSAGSDGQSFVYGDHRRRRRHNLPSSADAADQLRDRQPKTPTGTNERVSPRGQLTSLYRNDWDAKRSSQGMELEDAGVYINRPHSGSLRNLHESASESAETLESSRPASRSSNLSSASSRFGLGNYDMEEDADMLLHTARSRMSNSSEQAAEWGISNPTVVETMLKRNRRLKYAIIFDCVSMCVLYI
jgi:hypothetical protein